MHMCGTVGTVGTVALAFASTTATTPLRLLSIHPQRYHTRTEAHAAFYHSLLNVSEQGRLQAVQKLNTHVSCRAPNRRQNEMSQDLSGT